MPSKKSSSAVNQQERPTKKRLIKFIATLIIIILAVNVAKDLFKSYAANNMVELGLSIVVLIGLFIFSYKYK